MSGVTWQLVLVIVVAALVVSARWWLLELLHILQGYRFRAVWADKQYFFLVDRPGGGPPEKVPTEEILLSSRLSPFHTELP